MILPSGRVCRIRDKFVTTEGNLVLVCEYERAAHDHKFCSILQDGTPTPVRPDDPDVGPMIIRVLESVAGGTKIAVNTNHARGDSDPHGWLSHPHVAALGIEP